MKPRSLLLILLVLSCFAFMPGGDTPLAARIMAALRTHYRNYPQEKTYLQTDKFVYSSGQTIWFKIYTSVYGEPASLSKIVYVQLVGPDGRIVVQNKYPLSDGQAHGDILLPDRLQSNQYELRCFTAWMLNFDDSSVFHKTLYTKNIFDPLPDRPETASQGSFASSSNHSSNSTSVSISADASNKTSSSGTGPYDVQFFPEGGDLVDNITTQVAFKATDLDGLPIDAQGEIRDENQTLLTSFRAQHDGMGTFILRPSSIHHYTAVIHFSDRSVQRIPLPATKPSGIAMSIIKQTRDILGITFQNPEVKTGEYRDIVLAVCQNNGKVATYPLQMDTGINHFSISRSGLGTGILRLTIFDESGLPQTERIVFLEDRTPLHIELLKDTLSFDPRARSAYAMLVKDGSGKIDPVSLSVSVTDADRVSEDELSDNIYSSFLLTSELKGKIYNPGYYCNSEADSVKEALDLVMMTNGWRHFEWKQILDSTPVPLRYPVEDSLWIGGRIIGYRPGKSRENHFKMIIRQGDTTRFMGSIEPDSSGGFVLKDYNIPGLSTVSVDHANNGHYSIKYFTGPLDTVTSGIFVADPVEGGNIGGGSKRGTNNERTNGKDFNEWTTGTWKEDKAAYLLAHKTGVLDTITIKGRIPSKIEALIKKHIVNHQFDVIGSHDLDFINNFYSWGVDLTTYLTGRIPGLRIEGTPDAPQFFFRSSMHGGAPNVYVDESPSSYDAVKYMPLAQIALIRFIPPPDPMASPTGALAIYLKKPGEDGYAAGDITKDHDHYIFHGYSITRQFYSPQYSISTKDPVSSKPDTRTTLYWNPDLTSDGSNPIRFHFYNSDRAKKFRIVAEGMDRRGRLIFLDRVIY